MVFKKLKLRDKLLVSFLVVFIPLLLMGSILVYYQVKNILETSIQNEMENTIHALEKQIKTSAVIAIKGRLQAIAEQNLNITQYLYSKYRSGLLTKEEAVKNIREFFLNQPIGISGYIYCLDSFGNVVIHPNDKVEGTNVSNFTFVQKQMEIKDGYLEYDWKNPGESHKRPKALYMVYYKPLDWIISVSSYREEFSYLLDINDFRESVASFQSKESGYAFILDESGKALVHPNLEGVNLLTEYHDGPKDFINQVLAKKNGMIRYPWKNPQDPLPREKIVFFRHLPEFGWIFGATSYVDEIYAPLNKFKFLLGMGLVTALCSLVFLTFVISRIVTRSLDQLIPTLESAGKGNYSVRMNNSPTDDLGKLATHFNLFMDRLENSHKKLNNEIQKNMDIQAVLVENELKLRGLFNQSFQHTGILSPNGVLEEINQSALEFGGCKAEDVLYKHFWDTLWWQHDPASAKKIKQAVQKALGGTMARLETTAMASKLGPRTIDITIKPIFNARRKIEFLITEGRDITELKKADQKQRRLAVQLEKSQKMEAIGTLAGGIAHDFNNILSSIFGYCQLTEMTLNEPDTAKKHIQQITKGAQRAADLVQQILTFSRQKEFKKQPLRLHLVVKEALKLLRPSIPTTIEIVTHINSRAMVNADPTQMHQLILNLCTNGYHAMQEKGGVLTVKLCEVEQRNVPGGHLLKEQFSYLMLLVQDTGIGMDKTTLKKAFDPYFTTKEIGRGTGFGLTLVHAIVEGHRGIIHVETTEGKGTEFYIFFPRVDAQKTDGEKAMSVTDLARPLEGTESIMVVDDESDIRLMTREVLKKFGYRVRCYENGEEAFNAFKTDPAMVDLVISDMTMPKMTGEELSAKISSIRPELPIVLCTGYSESMSKEKARQLGIRKYLNKPFHNRELLTVIRELLTSSEKLG